jgi:hypothetical protein
MSNKVKLTPLRRARPFVWTSSILLAALIAAAQPGWGHHSLAASYFLDQQIIIEGTLVKLDIANPHSFIFIDVLGANRTTLRWLAEWVDPRGFACAKVDPTALKAGDKLRITGAPGRDPAMPQRLLVESVTRLSDGWTAKGLKDTWNDFPSTCSLPMPAWATRGTP